MSNFILPLLAQMLSEALAALTLFVQLLNFCVRALIWDPYLAAVVFVVLNGGTLLNLYSRYRLPRVVHTESLLQIPWACWLLGGGIRGIAFAAFFVIFRLRLELRLNRSSQHVELLSRKARKRAKRAQPVPVHQLDYTIWNMQVAFFLAAHLWLIQGIIAGKEFTSCTSLQYVKLFISLCVVWHVWTPSLKTGEEPASDRWMLAWNRIDRAAKADLESV